MRAVLILIGVIVVLAGAGLASLLIYGGNVEADQTEVRIELENAFPD